MTFADVKSITGWHNNRRSAGKSALLHADSVVELQRTVPKHLVPRKGDLYLNLYMLAQASPQPCLEVGKYIVNGRPCLHGVGCLR
jgi:hypothetical protein